MYQDSVDDMFCIPDENSQLGDEEAELLERTVTEAELHSALASMKNGSSPGMDGIPVEIYKNMPVGDHMCLSQASPNQDRVLLG